MQVQKSAFGIRGISIYQLGDLNGIFDLPYYQNIYEPQSVKARNHNDQVFKI